MVRSNSGKIRAASYVKLVSKSQSTAGNALQLLRTEIRNDGLPFPDGGRGNPERPRDIRGCLKVINNVLLEHKLPFTTVKSSLQPQCKSNGLTSVAMDRLATIAERLNAAMTDAGVTPSELSRACGVAPSAVYKWQHGGKMSADNSAAAARALGVREEWLRTGRLPRERDSADHEEGMDDVLDILRGLREPLAALATAIDKLNKPTGQKKHGRR